MEEINDSIKKVSEPNISRWSSLVAECKQKYSYYAELSIFIRNLTKALKIKEGEFLKEASEALDEEGKKCYSNAELREAYVRKKLFELSTYNERSDKEEELIRVESDIKGLEIEADLLGRFMSVIAAGRA